MKWNIEWVDLQTIERMIAECWRLGDKQLQQYYDKLLQQKDLVFAGPLGLTFLGLMNGLLMEDVDYGWSELQKDVHMLQKLIQQGAKQDRHYWNMQYHELEEQPEFYFYTALGHTFMEQIAEKLELNVSDELKFLRHDIQMIQKICETCDWQNEEMAKKAIAYLKEKEQMVFHSWVGFDFVQKVQERFGEKEVPVQLPQPETNSHWFFRKKASAKKIKAADGAQAIEKLTQDVGSQYGDEIDFDILQELDSLDDEDIINDQEAILSQGLSHDRIEEDRLTEAPEKMKAAVKKLSPLLIGIFCIGLFGLWMMMQEQNKSVHDIWMQIASIGGDKYVDSVLDNDQASVHLSTKQYLDEKLDGNTVIQSADGQIESSQSADGQTKTSRSADSRMKDRGRSSSGQAQDGRNIDVQAEGNHIDGDRGIDNDSLSSGPKALDQETADTGISAAGKQEVEMPDVLPQYEEFHSQYPDLFGWLKIPDTEIDHPVMQSAEYVNGQRYFYLNHDYAGNESEQGSLFVESQSNCFPQDNNTVIYGHNMSNGHNFGMLERYQDIDFCRAHQTFSYDTIYETGTYEIVAVLKSRVLYQEEEGFRYYQLFNYHTKEKFQECVEFMKQSQIYDLGETLQYGDKLLMLSTCDYSQENGRLVVVGKKID